MGPDNGIFTLIFPELAQSPKDFGIVEVPFDGLNFSYIRAVLAHAVGHLTQYASLQDLGKPTDDIVQRITFQPVIAPAQIRGAVIYVDNYGNIITNVTRDLFDRVGRGRPFHLYFKRHDPVKRLSEHYNDVPIGETLCLFNAENLEIAINMGKAAEMYGLKVEDTIQIDFQL